MGKKQHKKRKGTQNNTKTQNTQNRKQKYKTKNKHNKNIKTHKLSGQRSFSANRR